MNKSVCKMYEIDRSYDYNDWWDTKNAKKFCKKRSHKRLRQQFKNIDKEEIKMLDLEFINAVRENTKAAINQIELEFNKEILIHYQSEHFQTILEAIKTASRSGQFHMTLIPGEIKSIHILDVDCLKEMGFIVNYTMDRYSGLFKSMIVSWDEEVDKEN